MPTLAPKLPWQHAFAGGYPRRGGQALPVDSDAIDYLNRVAAADGASVEVGIAQAIDAFVRGCKADGTWDAIQASCIMCGARTLSGALVPLKGTAPTPYNFASGDYSRSGSTPGLKGNGTTKYLNSNYLASIQYTNDTHLAVWHSQLSSTGVQYGGYAASIGCASRVVATGLDSYSIVRTNQVNNEWYFSCNSQTNVSGFAPNSTGLMGASRSDSANMTYRRNGASVTVANASRDHAEGAPYGIFGILFTNRGGTAYYTDARLSFYSIGSALDLAALDTRVTNMVTAIRFHTLTGLLPNDYDPATIAYITAAYAAGGTL